MSNPNERVFLHFGSDKIHKRTGNGMAVNSCEFKLLSTFSKKNKLPIFDTNFL